MKPRRGTLAQDGVKKCARCQKTKTVSEYYKFDYTKDGLHSSCRQCILEARKQPNLKALERDLHLEDPDD